MAKAATEAFRLKPVVAVKALGAAKKLFRIEYMEFVFSM